MDGAMGSELRRAGLGDNECGELWNLIKSERVEAIHRSYLDAGARCLLTNTFQANPAALARHGLDTRLEEINRAAVEIARSAAGNTAFVLASIGPLPQKWHRPSLRRVVASLQGADGFLLETFSDLDALWAVKYGCLPLVQSDLTPVLLSIAYWRTSEGILTTHGGQTPEVFARLSAQYGVAALGVNCGRDMGTSDVVSVIRRYRQATDLPLFARPNAGTPVFTGGAWRYPLTPEEMVEHLPELVEAGAIMIGGCCGTTPEHIRALAGGIGKMNAHAST
jgi:methionine synthase I (cobalamin-dependent)